MTPRSLQATFTPTALPEPSATFTLTLAPTSTPTLTPTALPSPTPTRVPHDRLIEGRRLQAIGDCDAAHREFAAVVAAGPTPADTAEARFWLAQCYLRDDGYSEAVVVLTQLLATAPADDPYRTPSHFALAEALALLGRRSDAEASYREFMRLAPELSSLAWQRIGAARRGAKDLPGATAAYTAALESSPDWGDAVTIRRTLADLATAQSDFRGAAAQYDVLRASSTLPSWVAEMQWLTGLALTQAGAPAEALSRWQAAVDADPTSESAHLAVVALLNANAPVDEYQRGLVNYYQGEYALAVAAFDRLREVEPAGRGGTASYYAAISYLRLGNYRAALAELNGFIADHEENPLWVKAWLAKGDALAAAGDTAGALTAYRQLADRRPAAAEAPQALWRAAALEEKRDGPVAAAPAYLDLGRRYPAADDGWRAYQTVGLAYFRAAEYRRAADTWAEMAGFDLAAPAATPQPGPSELPTWTQPVALYWLGRAEAALGDTETAHRAWAAAWAAGPDVYYGIRAREWAKLPAVELPSPSTDLAVWLRGWAGDGSLDLPAAVRTDPDWRRGELLVTLNWRTLGMGYWERVQGRYVSNPWTLAALARAFQERGAYRLSMLCAEQLVGAWGKPLQEAPVELQRLAYPLAYPDLLRGEAAKRALDPRLVAAVIRQESRFEWNATSSAGAQGLMQLMPDTARWIAGKLGSAGFQMSQAYWPSVNVAFGAYYLRFGLDQFDGSLAAALAGYNGGPGNATKWRSEAGGDDDLMVALIPFGETRLYVQMIWAQYDTYKRLYP